VAARTRRSGGSGGSLGSERVVVALGGNAIVPAGRTGTADEQTASIAAAMAGLAGVIAGGVRQVVLTHGNGPQVGNLLLKNELARDVVPPVPLDWCVAQTQATIGFTLANALGDELAGHGAPRTVVPLVSRVLVAADDPAFSAPTKPVGPRITDEAEVERRRRTGQTFAATAAGWRRTVPSPTPLASLELEVIRDLLDGGAVVVANGGGGVPTVRGDDGRLRGVEAVIDKDLAGALLATELGADRFVILTDVRGVAVGYGTPEERWLGEVPVAELRALAASGAFGVGSMGPKVEAACRFVEAGGDSAVIASLDEVGPALEGRVGTRVVGDRP